MMYSSNYIEEVDKALMKSSNFINAYFLQNNINLDTIGYLANDLYLDSEMGCKYLNDDNIIIYRKHKARILSYISNIMWDCAWQCSDTKNRFYDSNIKKYIFKQLKIDNQPTKETDINNAFCYAIIKTFYNHLQPFDKWKELYNIKLPEFYLPYIKPNIHLE